MYKIHIPMICLDILLSLFFVALITEIQGNLLVLFIAFLLAAGKYLVVRLVGRIVKRKALCKVLRWSVYLFCGLGFILSIWFFVAIRGATSFKLVGDLIVIMVGTQMTAFFLLSSFFVVANLDKELEGQKN